MFYDFVKIILIFLLKKMREAFALQNLLTFFQQKYWPILDTGIRKFNETLTNDIVSFEQPAPCVYFIEDLLNPSNFVGFRL